MVKPRQGGLGRGLGALIPADAALQSGPLRDIPVGAIRPNSYQPRQVFDEEALLALTASIRELGVLQPILVRQSEDGSFEIIAGERRWRAATRAGLDMIPAIVRDVDDQTSLAHAIVENVQRAELNPIEEAAAFAQLIDEFSLTQEQVAQRIGRSRPAIANSLRLLQLPIEVQRLIIEGRLSAGHGRVLVSVADSERDALVARILDEALSVRALEGLVRAEPVTPEPETARASAAPRPGHGGNEPREDGIGTTKPPALLELEELLGDRFDTKVTITMGTGRGRIGIEFADIDDLERIYALILAGEP